MVKDLDTLMITSGPCPSLHPPRCVAAGQLPLIATLPQPWDPAGLPEGWSQWLLVRQQVEPTEGKMVPERAYYRCAGPTATPLRELIRVAGTRWAIEECFQTAKNEAGLDHYQVRTWRAWYAHITLAMLAAGWLAVARAHEHQADQIEKGDPAAAVTATTPATTPATATS